MKAAGPEATRGAQLGDAKAVIGIKGEREGDARGERGNVGLRQAAQCVDGAGDQGAKFLCVRTTGFVHHAGVYADQTGASEGAGEAGQHISQRGERVGEGGG